MEIHTTINNGLPVIVSGDVVRCSEYEYPGHDWIDNFEVRFKSGHPYTGSVSDADDARIVAEFFEQWRER